MQTTNVAPSQNITEHRWFVPAKELNAPQGARLRPASTVSNDEIIGSGQAFTIVLKSFQIVEDLENGHGGNDLLVRTIVDYDGERVELIHQFEENSEEKEYRDVKSDFILTEEDYDGQKTIKLNLVITEIDEGLGSKDDSLARAIGRIGGLFPEILPFVEVTKNVIKKINVMRSDSRNKEAFTRTFNFNEIGETGAKVVLRPGAYVLFKNDVDGSQFALFGGDHLISAADPSRPVSHSYVVIEVVKGYQPNLSNLAQNEITKNQKMESILAHLKEKEGGDNGGSMPEALESLIRGVQVLKALKRYRELKRREKAGTITAAEHDRLKALENDEELKELRIPD